MNIFSFLRVQEVHLSRPGSVDVVGCRRKTNRPQRAGDWILSPLVDEAKKRRRSKRAMNNSKSSVS